MLNGLRVLRAFVRLSCLRLAGRLLNLAGLPGFIRECDYASQLGVTVRVRKSPLFTVVTVNGVDVYFYRLTGGCDGVGFSPECCGESDNLSAIFGKTNRFDTVSTPK